MLQQTGPKREQQVSIDVLVSRAKGACDRAKISPAQSSQLFAEAADSFTRAAKIASDSAQTARSQQLKAEHEKTRQHLEALADEALQRARQAQEQRGSGATVNKEPESRPNAGKANPWDVIVDEKSLRIDTTGASLDQVIGLEDVKDSIRRCVIKPLKFPEQAAAYGASFGGKLLLYGPPGTGKTEIVRAVAAELGLDCLKVSASEIKNPLVGQSEKFVQQLFDLIERKNKPVILVLDECHAVLASNNERGANSDAGIVAKFRERLDGLSSKLKLFTVMMTNEVHTIDRALLDRTKAHTIYVGLPTEEDRRKILDVESTKRGTPLAPNVDFKEMARLTTDYSGRNLADLLELASRIRFDVSTETGPGCFDAVTQEDLLEAFKKMGGPMDKSQMVSEIESWANGRRQQP